MHKHYRSPRSAARDLRIIAHWILLHDPQFDMATREDALALYRSYDLDALGRCLAMVPNAENWQIQDLGAINAKERLLANYPFLRISPYAIHAALRRTA